MMIALLLLAAPGALPVAPQFEPLAFLVGHCWRGDMPRGQGTDTHCFEPVYGGRHLRDRHTVVQDGREVYAGETVYSVEGDEVGFTYWNSLGGVGRGIATTDDNGFKFTGSIRATPASTPQPMQAFWRKVSEGYEVRGAEGGTPTLFRRVD